MEECGRPSRISILIGENCGPSDWQYADKNQNARCQDRKKAPNEYPRIRLRRSSPRSLFVVTDHSIFLINSGPIRHAPRANYSNWVGFEATCNTAHQEIEIRFATRSALAMIVKVCGLAGKLGSAAPSTTYTPGRPASSPLSRHSCAAG